MQRVLRSISLFFVLGMSICIAGTAPAITTQPSDKTAIAPATAQFKIVATGSPAPTYQWEMSTDSGTTWNKVSGGMGGTSSIYTTPATTLAQSGRMYHVIVSNGIGSLVASDPVTLTVQTRSVITTQPVSQTVTAPATATFSLAASGVPTPTYQWQVSTNGTNWTNISTDGTSASYITDATSVGDNGKKFRCMVTGAGGSINSTAVTLTVKAAPAITTQPMDKTAIAPATAQFKVVVKGNPLPTYQWEMSTDSGITWNKVSDGIGATTSAYTTPASALAQSGRMYHVIVANGIGRPATSDPAMLTVQTRPAITTQPVSRTVTAPATATFVVAASGVPSPTYQWQVSSNGVTWAKVDSGGTDATYTTDPTFLSDNGKHYRALITGAGSPVPSTTATLTVKVAPSITTQPTDTTVVAPSTAKFRVMATGNPAPTYQWQLSTNGGSTWTNVTGAIASTYTIQATALSQSGRMFQVIVKNGIGNPVTSIPVTLTVHTRPVIVSQPLSQKVTVPAAATFTIVAKAVPSPTYQWQVSSNGTTWTNASNDADSSDFTTDTTTIADSGKRYRCVVTSSGISIASSIATLTVNKNYAPSNFSVIGALNNHDYLCFQWTPSNEIIGGYEIEGKVQSQVFTNISGIIDPKQSSFGYLLPSNSPECRDYVFRMQTLKNGQFAGYSNEAVYSKGLNLPEIWVDDVNIYDGINLWWGNHSQIANSLILERGVRSGMPGAYTWSWAQLPGVDFGNTYFKDISYPEASWIRYRVTYSKDNVSASAQTDYDCYSGMIAPRNLKVKLISSGARLDWENLSTTANEMVVMRKAILAAKTTTFVDIAHLTSDATYYEDTGLSTGGYIYKIEARQADSSRGSNEVTIMVIPSTGSLKFDTEIVSMPKSIASVVDSSGNWYLADILDSTPTIIVPNGINWEYHKLDANSTWNAPYILLDKDGFPHAIYLIDVYPGSAEKRVCHAWYDGTEWRAEEIARRTIYADSYLGSSYSFVLDKDGMPHVYWANNNGYLTLDDVEYAFKNLDGTWTIERLNSITPEFNPPACSLQLMVDNQKIPHFIVLSWRDIRHLQRTAAGEWTSEPIPIGSLPSDYIAALGAVFYGDSDLKVFFERSHTPYDPNMSYDYCVVSKTTDIWQPLEVIGSRLHDGNQLSISVLAQNMGATRITSTYRGTNNNNLLTYDSNGWGQNIIGLFNWAPRIGFTAKDKIYILQQISDPDSSTNMVFYVEYKEAE
jgi:hypothetical protein